MKLWRFGWISLCCVCSWTVCLVYGDGVESPSLPDPLPSRSPVLQSQNHGEDWLPVKGGIATEAQSSFLARLGGGILLATDNAGLFIDDPSQGQWRQIGQGLPGKKLSALEVFGNEIYVSVYGEGLYRSEDFGQNWQSMNAHVAKGRIQSILKTKEAIIIGADNDIFRWDEDSNQWTSQFSGVQVVSLDSLSDRVVAGTNSGVLLGDRRGNDWTWSHQEGALHSVAVLGETIFAMYILGDLFLSNDGGRTWENVEYAPRHRSYVYDVARVGDAFIMSNNYGVHRSRDGGRSWTLISQTEDRAFLDFLVVGESVYGGVRIWNEYRERSDSLFGPRFGE